MEVKIIREGSKKTGRKITQDDLEEWISLHNRRYTYKGIAEKYERHPKTVGEHMREHRRAEGREEVQETNPILEELAKARFTMLADCDRTGFNFGKYSKYPCVAAFKVTT
jgi:hypothetical protein